MKTYQINNQQMNVVSVNCLLLLSLSVGFCVLSCFCNIVVCVVSSNAILLLRKRELTTRL